MPRIMAVVIAAAAFIGAHAAPAPGANVPDGFRLDADGATLVHETSGFRFPRKVGQFARTAETSYDPDGHYVEIHYSYTPAGRQAVEIRMSLVNIEEMTAAEHYAAITPQAQRYFSAISVVSEGPLPARRDGATAYRGIFSGTRGGEPWAFSLTTIDFGAWAGRIATAYPAAETKEAGKALDGFVASFPGRRRSADK